MKPVEGFDPGPPTKDGTGKQHCCQMSALFVMAIFKAREEVEMPLGVFDFVEDWNAIPPEFREHKSKDALGRQVLLRPRFCPWCGHQDYRFYKIEPPAEEPI